MKLEDRLGCLVSLLSTVDCRMKQLRRRHPKSLPDTSHYRISSLSYEWGQAVCGAVSWIGNRHEDEGGHGQTSSSLEIIAVSQRSHRTRVKQVDWHTCRPFSIGHRPITPPFLSVVSHCRAIDDNEW